MMVYLYADSFFSKHDYHDMLNICAAKIQIFSQTNVKMLRLFLYLQQFNDFSRLS